MEQNSRNTIIEYQAAEAVVKLLGLSNCEIIHEPYGRSISPDFLMKGLFYLEVTQSGGGFDIKNTEEGSLIIDRSENDTPGIRDKITVLCEKFLKQNDALVLVIKDR